MTKLTKILLLFVSAVAICFVSSAHAGTVRMLNDTAYTLRAVIRGADGSYLGELVLSAQSSNTWTDSFSHLGHNDEANTYEKGATRSQTPYTVLWYCMDGSDFSVCDNVGTGSYITAQQCPGKRSCKPAPKKPGSFRAVESGEENITPPEE